MVSISPFIDTVHVSTVFITSRNFKQTKILIIFFYSLPSFVVFKS